jgi:Tfp pilus assembly ATPase PilU
MSIPGIYFAVWLRSERMYSMDDLLHLANSDGADELRLHVGTPPIVVLDGEQHPVEGPAITPEDVEHLLQSIANTRQRRELRSRGAVQFIYRFRRSTDFVVCARIEDENVGIDIH